MVRDKHRFPWTRGQVSDSAGLQHQRLSLGKSFNLAVSQDWSQKHHVVHQDFRHGKLVAAREQQVVLAVRQKLPEQERAARRALSGRSVRSGQADHQRAVAVQDRPPKLLQVLVPAIGGGCHPVCTRRFLAPELQAKGGRAQDRANQQPNQDIFFAMASFVPRCFVDDGSSNRLRHNLAGLECYSESTLGNVDNHRIVRAFSAIILSQLLPQTRDVHPHYRFLARIIGGRLGENIQAYRVFFQAVSRSGERLLSQIVQKVAMHFRGAEGFALDDSLDLRLVRFQLDHHRYLSYGMLRGGMDAGS